ncbi:myb domain-containing protein [Dictyostelium discoideum AX4]|uniref:Myb-like protein R n=1 Tax=Dictyostelium discoideum TaxID=44689 RepID=MYBR_DICDI|nr:myb domain-containing protein [Dictyostelium discoideum AX4]Q54DP7.2 RecName: Full=Myb-like protein R [Dictyostelium discoideum]EAL61447.2 myb domain-containing protein [Dictyostelium discoideum AX4]|eukprot:XP_629825.2 myb domain-containing protein [Dictyostelium discoideum AX4]
MDEPSTDKILIGAQIITTVITLFTGVFEFIIAAKSKMKRMKSEQMFSVNQDGLIHIIKSLLPGRNIIFISNAPTSTTDPSFNSQTMKNFLKVIFRLLPFFIGAVFIHLNIIPFHHLIIFTENGKWYFDSIQEELIPIVKERLKQIMSSQPDVIFACGAVVRDIFYMYLEEGSIEMFEINGNLKVDINKFKKIYTTVSDKNISPQSNEILDLFEFDTTKSSYEDVIEEYSKFENDSLGSFENPDYSGFHLLSKRKWNNKEALIVGIGKSNNKTTVQIKGDLLDKGYFRTELAIDTYFDRNKVLINKMVKNFKSTQEIIKPSPVISGNWSLDEQKALMVEVSTLGNKSEINWFFISKQLFLKGISRNARECQRKHESIQYVGLSGNPKGKFKRTFD